MSYNRNYFNIRHIITGRNIGKRYFFVHNNKEFTKLFLNGRNLLKRKNT